MYSQQQLPAQSIFRSLVRFSDLPLSTIHRSAVPPLPSGFQLSVATSVFLTESCRLSSKALRVTPRAAAPPIQEWTSKLSSGCQALSLPNDSRFFRGLLDCVLEPLEKLSSSSNQPSCSAAVRLLKFQAMRCADWPPATPRVCIASHLVVAMLSSWTRPISSPPRPQQSEFASSSCSHSQEVQPIKLSFAHWLQAHFYENPKILFQYIQWYLKSLLCQYCLAD